MRDFNLFQFPIHWAQDALTFKIGFVTYIYNHIYEDRRKKFNEKI